MEERCRCGGSWGADETGEAAGEAGSGGASKRNSGVVVIGKEEKSRARCGG